ncbi:MAG: glycoside hydrolase [Actinomycetota bacterium]|nr:glycoside hydrolase [Actinomycetota bacterium]
MKRLLVRTFAGSAVVAVVAVPAFAGVGPLSQVSSVAPFAPGCNGAPQTGTVFPNSEVEPWVDVNPVDAGNMVGAWQQNRWSNGGADALLAAYSDDGGATWSTPALAAQPPFSRCAGGNAGNGGDFERATDPWVTFGPDGDVFFMSLSINDSNVDHALLVSRSTDGGQTWGPITTLLRENDANVFNDKNSMTADHTDPDNVYAVWDRLVFPTERASATSAERALAFKGPAVFTRTTNDGVSWEPVRVIYDPGRNNQTIGNQIAVMPDGDLVNVFDEIRNASNKPPGRGLHVALVRSGDQGETWSGRIHVSRLGTVGITDPRDGAPVRTGDIIPEVASDERPGTDSLYLVWQDARFTGGERDQVAFSRSTDGGSTWSTPVRVSSNLDTQAFTPSVDVADDGTIAVTYYDFSADTVASPTLDTQYWVTTSSDGGLTWSPREEITDGPFDMRSAPFARGFFVGDYEGLESAGNDFIPFASFANTGDQSNPTDIFATTATP